MEKIYLKQFYFKNDKKPSLLLQVCCGPDLVLPLIELKEVFTLYLYWYNPNIQPYSEYKKRYKEYIKLLKLEKWDYFLVDDKWQIVNNFEKLDNEEVYNTYDEKEFYEKLYENREIVWINEKDYDKLMQDFSKMEEKNSARCDICYYTRLLEPAKIAKKLNIDYFSTTLLISPKKSVEKLNKYWKIVSEKIWVNYLSFNFRKNDGFKKAAEYTKNNNIRRQNYCGCLWAKNK